MIACNEHEIVEELARRGRGEPSLLTVPEAMVLDLAAKGKLIRTMVKDSKGAAFPVYRPREAVAA